MSEWRHRDPDELQKLVASFAVGCILGLGVLALIVMSRGGDGRMDSQGFDVSVPGAAAPAPPIGPMAERRADTGLSMVRMGDVDAGASGAAAPSVPPPSSPAPLTGDPGAPPAAAPPPPAAAPDAAGAPPPPAGDGAADAARLGVDAKRDAGRLGAQPGLLSALAAKAMEHPAALRYLLNNKTLVDAYFSRDLVQKNCSSGAALKSYLSNPNDPNGVSEEVSLAKMFLQHPDAASAASGSEFGKRMMECPSVGQLSKDPGAALVIMGSNPQLMSLLSDPNAAKSLAGNPAATSLLGGVTSSIGTSR